MLILFFQSESNRKIEEKDRLLSDLKIQMSQKDKLLKQQQEQIETLTQQLQDLNSFKVGFKKDFSFKVRFTFLFVKFIVFLEKHRTKIKQ